MPLPKDPAKLEEYLKKLRENSKKGSARLKEMREQGLIKNKGGAKKGGTVKEETRRKISASLTGRVNGPPSQETKEKIRQALKGQTISQEQRDKISATLTGRKNPTASRTKLLKNGTGDYLDFRESPLYKEWIKAVKDRDNWTCQSCGKTDLKGRDCHAHHIKHWEEYPELVFELSNGKTLCAGCHVRIEPRRKGYITPEEVKARIRTTIIETLRKKKEAEQQQRPPLMRLRPLTHPISTGEV